MSGGKALAGALAAYLAWRWWNARKPPEFAESTAKPALVMAPGAPITLTMSPGAETAEQRALNLVKTIDTKNFIDPSLFTFAMTPSVDQTTGDDILKLLHAQDKSKEAMYYAQGGR